MKTKYIKIFFLLLVVCAISNMSCNKFLDVPPQGKITAENYWQNRGQALAALAGMYSNLGCSKSDWTAGETKASATKLTPMEAYIYWGEIRGELLTTNVGITPADQLSKENVDAYLVAESDMTTQYTPFYRIINEANQAIKNIPAIPAKDPSFSVTEAQQFVGEAYYVRAFCYFWMARTFKDVPLLLVPSENDDQNYNVVKSTQQEIFTQIAADLEQAKSMLPTIYVDPQYQYVRATKYAAMATLADVYLWMAATTKNLALADGYYDKAITNCDGVINSGRYFLLPGPKYGDIWNLGGTNESIFETYGNVSLNSQTTSMYRWFKRDDKSWLVNSTVDNLFNNSSYPDYRSPVPPLGPTPEKGSVVSYDPATRLVSKYNKNDAVWVFYRYPDVLLMKAEAMAHRFPDDMANLDIAEGIVNQVRARAYGVAFPISVTSISQMDDALLDERGREFIAEGKRWFDLIRFASRDNFAHPELLIDRVVASRSGSDQLLIRARVVNPESWYFPLNADELAANRNLVQNSYYK